ncbi:type II toxin-antitoxin system HicB family antitoxin [Persicitalea sp.]|uniref:type II toxin-antitoxin system HicB family antitoxin n=1 Tax=Persicitalea sp. TaxID=3100273 RepID=UPI003593969B
MEKYLVIVQKAKNNYAAYSPDVLGCVATGKTVEATLRNMQEALEMHLEGLAELGEEFPVPRDLAHYLQDSEPIAESNDLITYLQVPTPHLQGV